MSEKASPKKKKKRRGAPRKLKFTREGRIFILVTLGVGAAAVNTGNNLLYLVLGMLLSLIVLSGVLSEQVLQRLTVSRRLPRRAFAGTPALVELAVRNDKPRVPSYSIELEDIAPAEPTDRRCYFLKIGPGDEQVAAYPRLAQKRGVLRLEEITVRTRYPFGLFEKSRTLDLEDELLVYPALAHGAAREPGLGHAGPDVSTARLGVGVEVAGLRDYREGDEARAIHWRRTASLGRVVVRERQRDAARRVTLLLDEARPADADAAWDARFEEVVSRVATMTAHALEDGSAVEVVTRGGTSPLVLPSQPADPVWRFLALLQTIPAESAPELAARPGAARRFEVPADAGASAAPDEAKGAA